MDNSGLKLFTCPVDGERCPTGKDAQIFTTEVDKEYKIKKSFAAYSIREVTYCKYNIENKAELTTDRFKHNNFRIDINVEGLSSLYLIWIPNNT